jgi:hypothetical protein
LGIRTARKLHIGQQLNIDAVLLRFDEFCLDPSEAPSIHKNIAVIQIEFPFTYDVNM